MSIEQFANTHFKCSSQKDTGELQKDIRNVLEKKKISNIGTSNANFTQGNVIFMK